MEEQYMSTPNFLRHVLQRCEAHGIKIITRERCQHHTTAGGNPYLVLEKNGLRFSVGRIRRGKKPWQYRVFWPYPAQYQYRRILKHPDDVIELIMRCSGDPAVYYAFRNATPVAV